jgi:hypothetical protein
LLIVGLTGVHVIAGAVIRAPAWMALIIAAALVSLGVCAAGATLVRRAASPGGRSLVS